MKFHLEEDRALSRKLTPSGRRRWDGRYQRKDGTTFPVTVDVRCMELEGEPRFVTTSREISERKEVEDHDLAMRYAREELRQAGFKIVREVDTLRYLDRQDSRFWMMVASRPVTDDES